VRQFRSHGIEIDAWTSGRPTSDGNATGISGLADGWVIENTNIIDAGGRGLYVHGNDAQVGVATRVNTRETGDYAFYDICYYGNTYIQCHVANPGGVGAYYNVSSTTYYGSTYINCYMELTGSPVSFGYETIVIGGLLAHQANSGFGMAYRYPGLAAWNTGSISNPYAGYGWYTNGIERVRLDGDPSTVGLILKGNYFTGISTRTISGSQVQIGHFNQAVATSDIRITQNTASSADHIVFNNSTGTVGTIRTSGSTTTYNTTSDYRLKENAQDIICASERVKQLRPVTFNFTADPDTEIDGFIAHEVQEVAPYAVTGEKDGMKEEAYEISPQITDDDTGEVITPAEIGYKTVPDYQAMDASKLVPLLTAALQDALRRIEALEARV
jgi:hypothetical protein